MSIDCIIMIHLITNPQSFIFCSTTLRNGSVQVVFRVIFEIKVNKPVEKPPSDIKQKVVNAAIKEITKTNGFIGTLKFKPGSLTPLGESQPTDNSFHFA